MIPTRDGRDGTTTIVHVFQSRNRETYDSNIKFYACRI